MTVAVGNVGEVLREITSIGFLPLGAKREKATIELLKKHAAAVLGVVRKFEELIIAFSERDLKKVNALGAELDRAESDADAMRRKFEASLGEGAFLPTFRPDLSRLAERVDDVADVTQDAARAVRWRGQLIDVLAKAERKKAEARAIREGFVRIAGMAVKTVEALQGAIDALMSDVDKSIKETNKVELAEHESDLLEEKLIVALYRIEKLLDPISLMQAKEIIHLMGEISNLAEDAGDVIQLIGHTFSV